MFYMQSMLHHWIPAFAGMTMLLLLSACANTPQPVAEDSTPWQTISVNTPGVAGANCFLQAGAMSYPVRAPGTVNVRKTTSPMSITCFKGEHMVGEKKVAPACPRCGYPSTVTIAMALDSQSMQQDVRMFSEVQ